MSKYKVTSKSTLATRHLGIVAERAIHWWKYLPPSIKSWYEVEDMIGEVVLHVVKVSKKFDKTKARESTFVHHVADNKCMSILSRNQKLCRAACETVRLTELLERRMSAEDSLRLSHAVEIVERVLEDATYEVRDLLEAIFAGRVRKATDDAVWDYVLRDEELIAELRRSLWRCSATLDDFCLVLRHAMVR